MTAGHRESITQVSVPFLTIGKALALGWIALMLVVGVTRAASADPQEVVGGHTEAAPSAAPHGEQPHGEEHVAKPPLLDWDVGSAFWSIVVFVILLVVLRATAWKPILRAMQDRENFIRDSLDQAKKNREESEVKLKEYSDKIVRAHAEASAIVDEGRRDAEVLKKKIEDAGKKEAAAIVERARKEVGLATDSAIRELYTLSAKLATEVASRIIQKELDGKQHERLIQESIAELGKLHSDGKSLQPAGRG
ncbi:MAG: F0F1 ATP synthase subunit B [Planctomycetota bacterium]